MRFSALSFFVVTFGFVACVSLASTASAAPVAPASQPADKSIQNSVQKQVQKPGGKTAEKLSSRPVNKAYILEPGLFTESAIVIVDGKAYEAEGWSPLLFDLRNALASNQEALDFEATHEAWGEASGIVLWTGMAASATYALATPRDRFSSGIFWGTFGGSIVASLGLEQVAKIYLYKALRAYNAPAHHDQSQDTKTSELKMNLVPLDRGAGLSFALDF